VLFVTACLSLPLVPYLSLSVAESHSLPVVAPLHRNVGIMASVSNLDQDMRRLRLARYTPKAMEEVRLWMEEILKEPLPKGDLLDVLKDGTILCRRVSPT
jgi:hypothetical protein